MYVLQPQSAKHRKSLMEILVICSHTNQQVKDCPGRGNVITICPNIPKLSVTLDSAASPGVRYSLAGGVGDQTD